MKKNILKIILIIILLCTTISSLHAVNKKNTGLEKEYEKLKIDMVPKSVFKTAKIEKVIIRIFSEVQGKEIVYNRFII